MWRFSETLGPKDKIRDDWSRGETVVGFLLYIIILLRTEPSVTQGLVLRPANCTHLARTTEKYDKLRELCKILKVKLQTEMKLLIQD